MNDLTRKTYIAFIRKTIREDGIDIASILNHMALAAGLIPLEYFLAAARIFAKIIIDR